MSRDASVTLDWAGGVDHFRLAWGELAALQEACDCGPYVLLTRLNDGSWRLGDLSHVIRMGLIGGGMAPTDALKKVRSHVEARPPMESLPLARTLMMAACIGAPEEQLEKKPEAPDRQDSASTISRTEESGSAPSTEPAQS